MNRILQGCVFDRLPELEPGSIDCAVTSPPYWQLRSYLPKGHALKSRELGSERTPAEYVANMVRVFGLVRDAMADHGTLWINVGDTYSQYNANRGASKGKLEGNRNGAHAAADRGLLAGEAGNLCLVPQRLAISLADDGWIVRSIIVWHKPAPMPASIAGWRWMRCRAKVRNLVHKGQGYEGSVELGGQTHSSKQSGTNGAFLPRVEWQDCPGCRKCEPNAGLVLRRGSWRPTSSYEPILMLAKTANYFADGEPNKTPASAATVARDLYTRVLDDPDEQFAVRHDHETVCDAGANARDVQTWAAEPLREKHYAAFPTALVQFCLRAGTSAHGYCETCGAPWVRVVESKTSTDGRAGGTYDGAAEQISRGGPSRTGDFSDGETRTTGWRPSCRCPANTPRPALVLDPFAGSGRTGIACQRMGLDFTGVELNPEYAAMATRILHEAMPLFTESPNA